MACQSSLASKADHFPVFQIEVFLSCRSTRENERDFLIAEAETRSNDPLADNNNRATLSITRKFDQMEVNDLRYVPQEILSS